MPLSVMRNIVTIKGHYETIQRNNIKLQFSELSEQFSIDSRGTIRVRSDPPPLRATLVVRVSTLFVTFLEKPKMDPNNYYYYNFYLKYFVIGLCFENKK